MKLPKLTKLELQIMEVLWTRGPCAIRELTVQLAAKDLPQALRSTVIEIDFDGVPTVWCPVGDFFGASWSSILRAATPQRTISWTL